MLNLLLYYPRLFIALVFRPLPTSHVTLQHWVLAHIFLLWNTPWRGATDTIGMVCVANSTKTIPTKLNPCDWRTRVASEIHRFFYLLIILVWPLVALLIARRAKDRRYARWSSMINNFAGVVSQSESHSTDWSKVDYSNWKEPLSSFTFFTSSLYIVSRAGVHLPDRKNETDAYCRQHGIPTPQVFSVRDSPLAPGEYIIKPIAGSSAKGIIYTTAPDQYLADDSVIVQEVVRNPIEQRSIWGTNALASLRFYTVTTKENVREFAGAVLRIPVGDSRFDNTSLDNAYASVDRDGRLGRVYTDKSGTTGFSCHPTTEAPIEGLVLKGFEECVRLAIKSHSALAPGLPVLNSDIAMTERGPMLIEVNRSPGQYWNMYRDGFSEKCVQALCLGIARARNHHPVNRTLESQEATTRDNSNRAEPARQRELQPLQ